MNSAAVEFGNRVKSQSEVSERIQAALSKKSWEGIREDTELYFPR